MITIVIGVLRRRGLVDSRGLATRVGEPKWWHFKKVWCLLLYILSRFSYYLFTPPPFFRLRGSGRPLLKPYVIGSIYT